MTVEIHTVVFFGLTPYSLACGYKCFRITYCLHLQGEDIKAVCSSVMFKHIYLSTKCNNPKDRNMENIFFSKSVVEEG